MIDQNVGAYNLVGVATVEDSAVQMNDTVITSNTGGDSLFSFDMEAGVITITNATVVNSILGTSGTGLFWLTANTIDIELSTFQNGTHTALFESNVNSLECDFLSSNNSFFDNTAPDGQASDIHVEGAQTTLYITDYTTRNPSSQPWILSSGYIVTMSGTLYVDMTTAPDTLQVLQATADTFAGGFDDVILPTSAIMCAFESNFNATDYWIAKTLCLLQNITQAGSHVQLTGNYTMPDTIWAIPTSSSINVTGGCLTLQGELSLVVVPDQASTTTVITADCIVDQFGTITLDASQNQQYCSATADYSNPNAVVISFKACPPPPSTPSTPPPSTPPPTNNPSTPPSSASRWVGGPLLGFIGLVALMAM